MPRNPHRADGCQCHMGLVTDLVASPSRGAGQLPGDAAARGTGQGRHHGVVRALQQRRAEPCH